MSIKPVAPRKKVKATLPKANPPTCWDCGSMLYGGGRFYHTVVVDGIPRNVHAACATKMERDAR